MLKVRVDLDAAQPQLHHPGDLILPALHGGEEGAQADETVVLAHLTGDKVVDVLHLGGGGGGAGHGAAGNACLLLQCKERLHRGQVPGVCAVEAADGGRGLLCQLVGEDVGVNICNRHGNRLFSRQDAMEALYHKNSLLTTGLHQSIMRNK